MLDINIGLVLLTAIVFLALVFLLNSMLYRPLLTFMTQREESIRRDLENANSNEEGSEKLLEEAKAIIADAKAQASSMKKEAIEEVRAEVSKMVEAKKAELENRKEALMEEIKKEEESVRSTLISQMPLFKEALKAKFNTL
ncbi:F-type H+-transporting ATPase subunit b [Nitratiruptor sp. YY08-26]|uniref:F0F1 ATP synthase subunit B family protein n=1 Tax=unclassified Nitratiruptor TaxID=2624044 RepID=UPI0019156190|nr:MULTISPECIES: hypothetical protein [unclassified Nitratiruptor]BCD62533.1 F-type H+-transporting ATPase subunit b [Nitratiruptor sp. YY08-13]BCD66469.1 F-type H+-transporting ATPase subunit b [Nitratiruptor sp. YY08-26]